MKLSLSSISTVNASFEEDVAAYASAGFDAIGLWETKLPPDDGENRRLLAAHGLEVSNCVPMVPSFLPLAIPGLEGPPEPRERLDAICRSIERLAAYGPECVLCLSGPAGDRAADEARSLVDAGLSRAAEVARGAGVRLGFEPIHASQRDTAGFVSSLRDALTLLDKAGLPEVGIMGDTYHLADETDSEVAAIASRLTGLHVADWPAEGAQGDRVLPGEGRGRSKELIAALRTAGWDGTLDIEIFSTPDGFWSLPVAEAARRAHAAALSLTQ